MQLEESIILFLRRSTHENQIKFIVFLSSVIIMVSIISISIPLVEANSFTAVIQTENQNLEPITEIIPLDGEIGIEKTTLGFHAASDNTLPWGFVEGKIANHVADYPVIIQIYDHEGQPTHFAQTNVAEDGSYEYKFRVRNIDDNGKAINIFEGDYSVKIFKVVYLASGTTQV
jgi:hypothetical protein